MQRNEAGNEIVICLIQETYDTEAGRDESSEYERYKAELELEFGVEFEEVDVHPGASLPAFLTTISEQVVPLLPWLMAIFMSAKPVKENLETWVELAGTIKRFFGREVILSRNGAAVLAVDAIFEELGDIPKKLQLLNYGLFDSRFPEQSEDGDSNNPVCEAPRTDYLSVTGHRFRILADGVQFEVVVQGKDVKLSRLS